MRYLTILLILTIQVSTYGADDKWVIGASKSGVSKKVVEAIAREMQSTYQFNHYSFSERLELMKNGEIDIAAGLLKTDQREEYIHFLEPSYKEAADRIFIVLKGNRSLIQSYDDLQSLRIGTTHQSRYFAQFDSDNSLQKRPENSVVINFLKLIRGEIDTLIISENSQFRAVGELGIKDLVEIADYRFDNKTPVYVGISKKSHLIEQVEELEALVDAMKQRGEFSRIESEHYADMLTTNIFFSQEDQSYLRNKREITVCIQSARPPLQMLSQNGVYEGFGADIMTLIEERIDVPISIVVNDTWESSLASFTKGECEAINMIGNTSSLTDTMAFTENIISQPLVVLTHDNTFFVEDSRDLRNRKVAVSEAYLVDVLLTMQPELEVEVVSDITDGLKKVQDDDVFGFIDVLPVIATAIQRNNLIDLKVAGKLEQTVDLSIASRVDDPRLSSIIQRALNDIGAGQIAALESKWLSVNFDESVDYRNAIYVSIFFLIVLLIYSYKNRAIRKINHELSLANEKIQSQFNSLVEARKKAEESEQVKIQFIANMSHEIRTPMNGIIGYLQVLEDADIAEEHKQKIAAMRHSSKQLVTIVDDILDLSKLEQDGIELLEEPYPVKKMLENIYDIFQPSFAAKGVAFKIIYDDSLPEYLVGDELRIRQIITNLTSNALKFTDQGAVTISASFQSDDSLLKIQIEDTGIGISPDYLDELFTPFTQEDGHIARKYGGTGLGLNISQKLLDLMNGEIEVESTPAVGSIFNVSIPMVEAMIEETNEIASSSVDISDIPHCTVLIAEDNLTNQMVIKAMLKAPQITLEFANNGEEAINIARKRVFDLILMDIQMPVMDGLTATNKLRNEIGFIKPIIGVSANAMKDDIAKAVAIGMSDYLAKPIIKKTLYAKLHQWLT